MIRKFTILGLIALVLCGSAACLICPHWAVYAYHKVQYYYQKADVMLNLNPHSSSYLRSPEVAVDGLYTPSHWIAHGGGVGEFACTNCEEAVLNSLHKGFKFIEIDLQQTTDGHLVGAHTWRELKIMLGSKIINNEPMSRMEIEALRPYWQRTPLFADKISSIMQEHPEMVLVTDRVQDFELLKQQIPFADRMIVEAYSPHHCLRAFRAGFPHVAMTANSIWDLQQAQKYRIPGIVLNAKVMVTDPISLSLVRQLHDAGCCIMVHNSEFCDKPDFVHAHLGRNIGRIYTNIWSPDNRPPNPTE